MSKLNYDNIDYLKELAELVKAQELSELRLEDGDSRIILRREKKSYPLAPAQWRRLYRSQLRRQQSRQRSRSAASGRWSRS